MPYHFTYKSCIQLLEPLVLKYAQLSTDETFLNLTVIETVQNLNQITSSPYAFHKNYIMNALNWIYDNLSLYLQNDLINSETVEFDICFTHFIAHSDFFLELHDTLLSIIDIVKSITFEYLTISIDDYISFME